MNHWFGPQQLRGVDGLPVGGEASPLIVREAGGLRFDAFGRQRTAQLSSLIEAKHLSDLAPLNLVSQTTGTASIAHQANQGSALLSVGSASGDRVVERTKSRAIYQPGKSLLWEITALFPAPKTNVRARAGYFDDNDGVFFSTTDTGVAVVRRTSTSGSPVDETVEQAAWNIDRLDGSGPSGIAVSDWNKTHIFGADMQLLQVGAVRFFVVIGGRPLHVHTMAHAGVLSLPYVSNTNLPLTWELVNVGNTSGTTTMRSICAQVSSEGGYEPKGMHEAVNRGVTLAGPIGAGVRTELIALRLTVANLRWCSLLLDEATVMCPSTADFLWEVRVNPTGGAAGAWVASSSGLCEYNLTRGAVNGDGYLIDSGYGADGASEARDTIETEQTFGTLSLTGPTADVISLQVVNIAGNESYLGALTWRTLR